MLCGDEVRCSGNIHGYVFYCKKDIGELRFASEFFLIHKSSRSRSGVAPCIECRVQPCQHHGTPDAPPIRRAYLYEIKNPPACDGFLEVPRPGIEPGTHGFSDRCSTN